MDLIAEKSVEKLITPRGNAPISGKTEIMEGSWNPEETIKTIKEEEKSEYTYCN